MNTTVTRHEKVFTGYKPQPAYTPAEKVNRPLIADRSYIRLYGLGKNPVVSEVLREVRRRQLQQSVISCRKAIRNKAMAIQVDEDTRVVATTRQQKDKWLAMRDANKLVDCIVTSKMMS